MTLEDWSIFCKYNHRVRSLHMSRWAYKIGPEILSAIACPPFALPLLPNLTSLTWNASSVAFPCIRLFVTQGLTRLHINVHPEFKFSLSVQSTLSCIPMLCPSVSHFEFSGGLESGGASVAFQCWSQLISARTGKFPMQPYYICPNCLHSKSYILDYVQHLFLQIHRSSFSALCFVRCIY